MKSYSVKDLMVPLSEYATVSEDATLYEAVLSLEEAQEKFEDIKMPSNNHSLIWKRRTL